MTIELVMTRRGDSLLAAWPQDEATLELLPQRQLVTVKVQRTANPKRRAWYRAMLARLVEYTGAWPDPQEAHRQLLIRCGFAESCLVTDWGDIRFTPQSTQSWDDLKWTSYFNTLLPIIYAEHLNDRQAATFVAELEHLSGVDGREFLT